MADSCLRIIQAKTKAVRRRKSVNNAMISYTFTDTALGGWINGMLGGLLATGKIVLLLGRAAAWKSAGIGNPANRYRQD